MNVSGILIVIVENLLHRCEFADIRVDGPNVVGSVLKRIQLVQQLFCHVSGLLDEFIGLYERA